MPGIADSVDAGVVTLFARHYRELMWLQPKKTKVKVRNTERNLSQQSPLWLFFFATDFAPSPKRTVCFFRQKTNSCTPDKQFASVLEAGTESRVCACSLFTTAPIGVKRSEVSLKIVREGVKGPS